ncbi:MAG: hypothetical protein VX239_01275, partial [Candidatus Thermoplasmatota archaeon]|nr:hypothetical protein [Candidatus Thermoplasmatota archaeon]
MESGQSEETALRTIMLLALVGLLDSLYLSYLHHLVAGGSGCPTQDLPPQLARHECGAHTRKQLLHLIDRNYERQSKSYRSGT